MHEFARSETVDPAIENLVNQRALVFIFITNASDVETFLKGEEYIALKKHYELHFIYPDELTKKIISEANKSIIENNCSIISNSSTVNNLSFIHSKKFLHQNRKALRHRFASIIALLPKFSWKFLAELTKFAQTRHTNIIFFYIYKLNKLINELLLTQNNFKIIEPKFYAEFINNYSQLTINNEVKELINQFNPLFCILINNEKEYLFHTIIKTCFDEKIMCVLQENGCSVQQLATFCDEYVEFPARKLRGIRNGCKSVSISHTYGAHLVAKNYCGIAHEKKLQIPGYWMHGWIPEHHNIDPHFIALHKKDDQSANHDYIAQIAIEKESVPQWVARKDQEQYLRDHGYKHVKAIGLPIVYLPKPAVSRVPNSLLVLPPHGHHNHGPDDLLAMRYAKAIAQLKSQFKHIWVGIYHDDFARNQWVESFRKQGVNTFTTTDQTDTHTLLRLATILSTFEYVTTNGFGSHIALAAYFGAKISIYGPFASYPRQRMKTAHAVKMFPHLLDKSCGFYTESTVERHFPFLFIEPQNAKQMINWGAKQIGEDCKLSAADLAKAFKWEI